MKKLLLLAFLVFLFSSSFSHWYISTNKIGGIHSHTFLSNVSDLELDASGAFWFNLSNQYGGRGFGTVSYSGTMMFYTDLNTQNSGTNIHYFQVPMADATEDAEMIEFTLDSRYINITLTDEEFMSTGYNSSDFVLVNAPPGLTIESINNKTITSARLNLAFDGTDFDTHYNDFRISINSNFLTQSVTDLLTTSMVIKPIHEPEIINVDIPDHSHKVGDVMVTTITLDTDVDTMFTFYQGDIGGYTVDSMIRHATNYDTYYAYFTINEGGTDYAADVDVPVNNLQLKDGIIFGNIYTSPIANPNDLIDANTPVVTSILMISSGFQGVGDKIFLVVSADDKWYALDNVSEINAVSVTSPAINVTDNYNNTYTFNYTIQFGDQDVSPGNLTAALVFADEAGNTNVPFTTISSNDVSIDANPPIVDSAKVTSADMVLTIGEILDITIYADGTGYAIEEGSTTINGVDASEDNITSGELGGGEYWINYEIEDGDNEVTPGNLVVSIVMADPAGNISDPPITTLLNNNVTIDLSPPIVDSVKITSVDDTLVVGEILEISIYANGTGYLLKEDSTTINGVEASEDNITSGESGGGEYWIKYEILEGDNEVTPGNLAVSIVISNSAGITNDTPYTSILNNDVTILTTKPTAIIAGTQQICLGDTAELNITFTGETPWNVDYFGGSTTESITGIIDNPFFFDVITRSSGTFTYTITNVEDATGNNNTGVGSVNIQVSDLPDPEFVGLGDTVSICPESSLVLRPGSGYSTYLWSDGSTGDTLFVSEPGTYSVTVTTIWEFEGFEEVVVKSMVPYNDEEICMVTVSNDNRILVVWEKTYNKGIAQYNIYREQTLDNYIKIGSVLFNDLSVFIDESSIPDEYPHWYKISITDICGNESELSPFHKSIHLQTSVGISAEVNLNWDRYEGFNYAEYEIFRGTSSNSLNSVRSITAGARSWTDTQPITGQNYYRIMVVKSTPCYPSGLKSDEYAAPFSNLDTETIVGINEHRGNGLIIYPNPFNHSTTIGFNNPENHPYFLYIMDLTGKVCLIIDNITTSEYVLEKGDLKEGFYIVELRGPKIYRGKIVVE